MMNAMKLSQAGIQFLVGNEGLRLKPYLDTKGVPTIGIGCTYYEDGTRVKLSDPAITKERAYALFSNLVKNYESAVNRFVRVALSQGQFDALVDFCYNIGVTGFATSTLVKVLNAGQFDRVPAAIMMWNKNPELLGRRTRQVAYFQAATTPNATKVAA